MNNTSSYSIPSKQSLSRCHREAFNRHFCRMNTPAPLFHRRHNRTRWTMNETQASSQVSAALLLLQQQLPHPLRLYQSSIIIDRQLPSDCPLYLFHSARRRYSPRTMLQVRSDGGIACTNSQLNLYQPEINKTSPAVIALPPSPPTSTKAPGHGNIPAYHTVHFNTTYSAQNSTMMVAVGDRNNASGEEFEWVNFQIENIH